MKKIVLLLAILMLASFAMSSCGELSTPSADSGTSGAQDDGKSNLGEYNVVIDDVYVDGNLHVKYIFTNNSSTPKAFYLAVDANVYQDGIALERNSIYSINEESADIKPGASIEIEIRYYLRNDTSDIEIEMTPLFKSSPKLIKTFKIADLKK